MPLHSSVIHKIWLEKKATRQIWKFTLVYIYFTNSTYWFLHSTSALDFTTGTTGMAQPSPTEGDLISLKQWNRINLQSPTVSHVKSSWNVTKRGRSISGWFSCINKRVLASKDLNIACIAGYGGNVTEWDSKRPPHPATEQTTFRGIKRKTLVRTI